MRPRTILQTFDSSRYRRDARLDRMVDIAHARTETVLALLFGYEIVVPANDIADSPAVQTILAEVATGAGKFTGDFLRRHGHPFTMFSVGLDRRYRSGSHDLVGYNGYTAAYRVSVREQAEAGERPRELVALTEQGGDWSSTEMVCGMVATYLGDEPDWERAMERHHPGAHNYALLVRSLFNHRLNSEVGLEYSSRPLPADYSGLFHRFMRHSLARAKRRAGAAGGDEATAIAERIAARLARLEASDRPLAKRADWVDAAEAFEDDWEVVRDWLDLGVYGSLFSAFRVRVGSYFTQECSLDGARNAVRMGAVTERAFRSYVADDGVAMLPQLDRVDWEAVLTLAHSPPVADATARFHRRLGEAAVLSGAEREERLADARRRHVDFLLNHKERVLVETYLDAQGRTRREASTNADRWGPVIADGLRLASSVTSILLKTSGSPGDLQQLAAEKGVGRLAGGVGRTVSRLVRPSQPLAEDEGKLMVSRELDRLNYWIR